MDSQLVSLLNENRSGYLASVEKGSPRVRPFEFQFVHDKKFVFCTNSTKDVSRQIKEDSEIEFSTTSSGMVTVRIHGSAVFFDDKAVKEKIISENKLVGSLYNSADNPIFEIFYIEHGNAIISDFSGNPPRKFSF